MAQNSAIGWKLQQLWSKAIGMKLALWLDKRHPDWCWAEICSNVGLGWNIVWLWTHSNAEKCESYQQMCDVSTAEDSCKNGSCWCGKSMTPEMRRLHEGNGPEVRP